VDAACFNKLPFIKTGEDANHDLYSRVAGPALTLRPVRFRGMVSRSSTEQMRPKGNAHASGDLTPRDGELRHSTDNQPGWTWPTASLRLSFLAIVKGNPVSLKIFERSSTRTASWLTLVAL
jgi:hypothetical protein